MHTDMLTLPLISVIIPVYNVEQYLRRCIDSVIGQSYQNLEIILINDGSADHSGAICDEYAVQDSRIRVLHQENAGVSAARNAGLDICTGEYICFVDSDDYIQSDMLERLYQELSQTDATWVISGYSCVDPSGKVLSTYSVDMAQVYSGSEALYRHYFRPIGAENFVTVWGNLYQRQVFSDLRFRCGICFEDIHIMPYLYLQAEKVVLIPYVGYNYTQNMNGITHSHTYAHTLRLYRDCFVIWDDHLELYRNRRLHDFESAVYRACVNKVIAHSLADNIPSEMQKSSMETARRYIPKLILRKQPRFKEKLYFMLFYLLGPTAFKALMNARKSFRVSKQS